MERPRRDVHKAHFCRQSSSTLRRSSKLPIRLLVRLDVTNQLFESFQSAKQLQTTPNQIECLAEGNLVSLRDRKRKTIECGLTLRINRTFFCIRNLNCLIFSSLFHQSSYILSQLIHDSQSSMHLYKQFKSDLK